MVDHWSLKRLLNIKDLEINEDNSATINKNTNNSLNFGAKNQKFFSKIRKCFLQFLNFFPDFPFFSNI